MDVSEIVVPNTSFIHLSAPGKGLLYAKNKDGSDDLSKPVGINVYGPASNEAISYKRKAMKEAQGIIANKGIKGLAKRSTEETERKDVERLCAHTESVENLEYKGEKITSENIWKVYSDPKLGWIADQVREKLSDWESFLDE